MQTDGAIMGLPIIPTLSEFYMSTWRNKIEKIWKFPKPTIYIHYVDNIVVLNKNRDEVKNLRRILENNSILNFLYELNINNSISTLDILINLNIDPFKTSVY